MTSPHSPHDTPDLTSEERRFVEHLREHYSPPPMTASERVAFDEALESRVSRRGIRARILMPVAATGVVAIFAIWFALHSGIEPDPRGQGTAPAVVSETATLQEEVGDALLALAFEESNDLDTGEWLPEDYVTLSILLDDAEG